MVEPFDCYAVTPPGVEAVTARELAGLGLAPDGTEPGGVAFRADGRGLARANLELRTANRVLVRLARFHARAFSELERHATRVAWDRVVPPGAAVAFRVTSRKSRLYHQRGIAQRLLAAVQARVADVREPAAAEPAQEFVVRVFRDDCTISVDSSGALLHLRGYRQAVAKAPLRETLAAAILVASGWDGRAPLLDPFCGAGTIPIEAALLARRIPPGWRRRFAFERWPMLDPCLLAAARRVAEARLVTRAPGQIVGADRDAGAVAAARANAERAGVAVDIEFRRAAISSLVPPAGPGWLITNPPYGVRVGEALDLRNLYARFGRVVRERCPGWRVAVLSASRMLEGQTGLKLEPALRTRTGGIPVRLMAGGVEATAAAPPTAPPSPSSRPGT